MVNVAVLLRKVPLQGYEDVFHEGKSDCQGTHNVWLQREAHLLQQALRENSQDTKMIRWT